MKKFKEFRTEQKYIAEIGPIAATIGAVVGGIALYKGGKSLWNKFTGWKESQKEKKANKKAFVIDYFILEGNTFDIESPCWSELDEILKRKWKLQKETWLEYRLEAR